MGGLERKTPRPRRKDRNAIAIKLDIKTVERYDKETKEWAAAWPDLKEAVKQSRQLALVGVRLVLDRLADLYEKGKTRRGKDGPEVITDDDVKSLTAGMYNKMSRAAKARGRHITTGHVSSLAQDIKNKEFSDGATKSKMADIIHCKRGFPAINKAALVVNPNSWWIRIEDREIEKKGKKKIIQCPVIYITSLFPGEGRIRLVCGGFYGKGSRSKWTTVKRLEASERKVQKDCKKDEYGRGNLYIKRVKRPHDQYPEWKIIVSHHVPKVESPEERDCVLFAHRGIAHALMVCVIDKDDVRFHPYFGHEIVDRKAQFRARAKRYMRDTSPRGNGRGKRHRYKKRRSLGDKERRATETDIWNIVSHTITRASQAGVSRVFIEDMGTFRPDTKNSAGKAIPPYIRSWPFASLKGKMIDAFFRREGIEAEEDPTEFISQKCPCCGYTDKENIRELPVAGTKRRTHLLDRFLSKEIKKEAHRVSEGDAEEVQEFLAEKLKEFSTAGHYAGRFKCADCGFWADIDRIAILNMALSSGIDWVEDAITSYLERVKKYRSSPD